MNQQKTFPCTSTAATIAPALYGFARSTGLNRSQRASLVPANRPAHRTTVLLAVQNYVWPEPGEWTRLFLRDSGASLARTAMTEENLFAGMVGKIILSKDSQRSLSPTG